MDPHTVTRVELNADLESRVEYMKAFLEFTDEDCEIMKAVRPIAKPLVPEIVASAYNKLLSYDCCKIAFFPRKDGAQGTHGTVDDLVETVNKITIDSATIRLRRNILEKWAMKIFTADYNDMEIFEFFDRIGIQHVGGARVFSAGQKKPLFVDYIHLAMTLGYITDRMTAAILSLPNSTWPLDKKSRAVRAFHKIGWIHNDLLARHHMEEACEGSSLVSPLCPMSGSTSTVERTARKQKSSASDEICPMSPGAEELESPMPAYHASTISSPDTPNSNSEPTRSPHSARTQHLPEKWTSHTNTTKSVLSDHERSLVCPFEGIDTVPEPHYTGEDFRLAESHFSPAAFERKSSAPSTPPKAASRGHMWRLRASSKLFASS